MEPLLPLAGFLVGIVVGLTGVGGGSLMTPALVFGFGIGPAVAVGTDLAFAGVTKIIGVSSHRREGNVDWTTVGFLAAGSLPAAIVALFLLHRIPGAASLDALIMKILGLALIGTAGVLMFRSTVRKLAGRLNARGKEVRKIWIVFAGILIGGLVAFSSVGAGAIGVAVLTLCRPEMPTRKLIGSDMAHALPLALVAGLGYWHLGNVDFGLLLALLVGSIPGVYLGTALTTRVPEPLLRSMLAAVLATVGLCCIV